jgi:hypothetical protein
LLILDSLSLSHITLFGHLLLCHGPVQSPEWLSSCSSSPLSAIPSSRASSLAIPENFSPLQGSPPSSATEVTEVLLLQVGQDTIQAHHPEGGVPLLQQLHQEPDRLPQASPSFTPSPNCGLLTPQQPESASSRPV